MVSKRSVRLGSLALMGGPSSDGHGSATPGARLRNRSQGSEVKAASITD
jgi:hypothetical protein